MDGNFYPRSPCGERHDHLREREGDAYFYPRSPCGERPARVNSMLTLIHFYPRSPCGERPLVVTAFPGSADISIHALLAESDGGFGVGS